MQRQEPCNGTACTEPDKHGVYDRRMVSENDRYFATPCGPFCDRCFPEHADGCAVCANDFPEAIIVDPEDRED